jgi:hypothetical protein
MAAHTATKTAPNMCSYCGEVAAKHLEPVENGPAYGLTLENYDLEFNLLGSEEYCSHECWELDIYSQDKMAYDDIDQERLKTGTTDY